MKINIKLGTKDGKYCCFEKDTATVRVTNNIQTPICISEALIIFIVNGKEHKFTTQCNETINPDKTANLPVIKFTIGPWVKSSTALFKIGLSYRKLYKNKPSDLKDIIDSSTGSITIIDSPKQDKKIFISHSNDPDDKSLVEDMSKALEKVGFAPYVAENNPKLGSNLWGKIDDAISDSDLLIVLCTAQGARSRDVGEEIGFARARGKKIISVNEKNVDTPGSLLGEEYVPLDRRNTDDCVYAVVADVYKWASGETL